MADTPARASTSAHALLPTQLQLDPDRLARMWAMTPAQRRHSAQHGQLSLAEMQRWAARYPDEVPLVNGEFFYITALLADNE